MISVQWFGKTHVNDAAVEEFISSQIVDPKFSRFFAFCESATE